MGAGSFIIGTLIRWLDVKLAPSYSPFVELPSNTLDLSMAPIFWGPVMVIISAVFLILDLGIKRKFIYVCLNPKTSWLARGFIILSVFIVFGLVVMVRSLLPSDQLKGSALWHIPEVIAFVSAFGVAIYTGILLQVMKSVPLWKTNLLPLLFLVSALSTGSMAIILSTLGTGFFTHDSGAMRVLIFSELMLVVIEGVVLYLFLYHRYRAAGEGKDSVRLLLFGEMKLVFWGGIVLVGFIFPFILENVASLSHGNIMIIFIAGILLLCGGFFLRLGVLYAGIKEQIPIPRLTWWSRE